MKLDFPVHVYEGKICNCYLYAHNYVLIEACRVPVIQN